MTERTQWDHANKKHAPGCIHNPGVCCDTPYPAACAGCGWNPEIDAKRRAIMRSSIEAMYHRKLIAVTTRVENLDKTLQALDDVAVTASRIFEGFASARRSRGGAERNKKDGGSHSSV